MTPCLNSDSDEYHDEPGKRKVRKRRKTHTGGTITTTQYSISLNPLINRPEDAEEATFDEYMQILLPEYLRARAKTQVQESEVDDKGQKIRPLTRSEVTCLINEFTNITSPAQAMLIRRMKLHRERRRSNLSEEGPQAVVDTVTPLTALPPKQPVNQLVLEMLYNIETTPFENSFMSRLHGFKSSHIPGALFFDWGTITPWMNLMRDIHDHYSCAHPEREQTTSRFAPITYTSLQTDQLGQVHDLLARTFWSGINVKDSLDYSPERCTVVATYKKLVVGVAILSSPQETYITYLAIKAGWDNTHLARVMLYHLIMMNPNKDITLHVSTNNPAVLLYNRFGFKAEEFVAGFYENYLDYRSRASNNAFRLRLRQQ